MQTHLTNTSRNMRINRSPFSMDTETKNLDYQALLTAARRGDASAFERLCENASPRIFRTLTRITKNREDAQDALQEALMRAFINLQRFDGRSSFSTWLTRIAINAAFMKLRRSRLSREVPIDGPDLFGRKQPIYQFRDRAPNPEDKYAAHERGEILRDALSGLRPRVRAAVEIYQLQECSLKETAKRLGITVAAAKGRLFQAKAALRKASRTKAIGDLRFRCAA
jgi:RNA polymerase sigma factor (sigma-70 family)